ncbi:unnamed protein product [Urochloa decumbens]|uniref:Uncharacterized protein n=1 Tax=Urochloa decumbens TaxID=240449 RepID=A0ABC8XIK4_9POAL
MVPSEVVNSHGVHEVEGPLLVGGVEYLAPRTGLSSEALLLEQLRSDEAFRDYLEFRQEAFRKAASEMISSFKSPVDLFFLTDIDSVEFQRHTFNHRAAIQQYSMIADEESKRSRAANMSKDIYLEEDRILNKSRKDHLSRRLSAVRRYYAYRKSLLKLDFVQGDSDPESVLKRIKKSATWSGLDDFDLKRGLKSHTDLLKEHTSRFGSGSGSMSDYEKVALERINSEMGSALEKVLYYPDPDEFMRVPVKEHTVLPSLKQAAKHSVNGWIGYLRGGVAIRAKTSLRALGEAVIRGKTPWRVLGFGILGAAATFGMNEPELEPTI